ncbi:MAG: fumarylacetoacetate hydrolase family protein [Clostridiales bacterium]|nr:fumarylacetoacetate hydrolase family protein [Clostridiales bacterium]
MKLITCIYKNKKIPAVLSQDGKEVFPFFVLSKFEGLNSMNDLIETGTSETLEKIEKAAEKLKGQGVKTEEITLAAPIPEPKQDVICLGINYTEHAKESARYKGIDFEENRQYPVYFSKRVNEALPHMGKIALTGSQTVNLDYEAELAFIIGKDAENVKAENAEDYIFGYTVINDISARDLQARHKQWYAAKSLTGFCPMGPCIVTKDEIPLGTALKITSKVNGELRQNSSTDKMIFDIPYIIEELSSYFCLKAGTVISTGTPSGVGMGFNPPRFLNHGDRVDCEIEKIGTLTTFIV